MPTPTVELQHKTRVYWRISSQLNGRIHDGITVQQAINMCNKIILETNPMRPLVVATDKLRDEIISEECFANEEPAKVLPFARPALRKRRRAS